MVNKAGCYGLCLCDLETMSELFARVCLDIWSEGSLAPTCNHRETEELMAVTSFSSVDDLTISFK